MPEDGREIQDVGCMWSMTAREGVVHLRGHS